jgi:transposase InsO family protein
VRFEAAMPNERWQADITHWRLAGGAEVEILNVLDDHSRFLVASDARAVFLQGGRRRGELPRERRFLRVPGSAAHGQRRRVPAVPRKGRCAIKLETAELGIRFVHSSPCHPQTCGKVERFHQTLKRWLRRQPGAATLTELQAQLDRFRAYYNAVRPHRAVGRRTPASPSRPDRKRPRRCQRSRSREGSGCEGTRSTSPE